MRELITLGTMLAWAILSGAVPLYAQKATERFIPIGRSPGLSGVYSDIGWVDEYDRRRNMLVASSANGRWHCMVTERTKIWIDRSNRGAPNEIGSIGDLKRGWLVEVKYEDERSRENAAWIKVRPDARE